MEKKIVVCIATYNEKENIEKIIRKIFDLKIENLSVVVVDDNSPDGTGTLVKKMQNEFPSILLIERSKKLGYGTAYKAAFGKALENGAEIIISIDADFSHDPKEIPNLINQIEQGYDVVIGSRKIRDGKIFGWSLWRKFCSAGATAASKLLLGIQTCDLTNGFRAYKRKVFEIIKLDEIQSSGYSFLEEIIYLVEKGGFSVKEIPVIFLDREHGVSKLTRIEIASFFLTIFKLRINSEKKALLDKKNIPLIVLGLSFFIGIWHALPMLDVIGDEMYFVGGVLRAMENHTLIPALGEVPYGTITYILNYVLIGGFVLILFFFFGFNIHNLKFFLVESPDIVYLIPRLLSAFVGLICLSLFNNLLKKEVKDYKSRIFILILTFTNMLTVSVFHTGKMWVLSTVLVLISFYYLFKSLDTGINVDDSRNNRDIFLSIFFGFLGTANFVFFGFALINIPILLIFFRRNKEKEIKIVNYALISLLIFTGILCLNFDNTKELIMKLWIERSQTSTNNNLSILSSFWLYFKKILAFFPLHILAIAVVMKQKIKNKKLFVLAVVYFVTYFLLVSVIGTRSFNIYAYYRYVFPLGFFLSLILISLNIKFRKVFYIVSTISIFYFILTLYLISVPTTYNKAHDWIMENLNRENVVVLNGIRLLELPKNKESYLLYQKEACATKCRNIIDNNLNTEIKNFTKDWHSEPSMVPPAGSEVYYIEYDQNPKSGQERVIDFSNKANSAFDIETHVANYFDLDFFRIKNFGSDIYIYKDKL